MEYANGRPYWIVEDRESRRIVCSDRLRPSRFPSMEAATAMCLELKREEDEK